jgi:hypothetical protein
MGRARHHIGGGPGPMYQYYNTFLTPAPPVVEILATTNVEIGPKLQKH